MPVVVVDHSPPTDFSAGVRVVAGDCRSADVLERAGVREARGVVICTSDDLVNLSTALTVRSLSPGVRIVVRTFNTNLVARLGKAVSNVLPMSVSALAAPLIALIARTGSALGGFATPDGSRSVLEIAVTEGSALCDQPIDAVRRRVLPLALFRPGDAPAFLQDIPSDTVLQVDDRLAVCAPTGEVARLTGDDEDAVRWAGTLRRGARVVRRFLFDVEPAVKICAALLAVVLAVSVGVFHFYFREPLATAFYHTVGLMATSGDLKADTQPMQVFVSVLRICGALLLACFTAILTNYLVRARLGGALELRRIPDGGHVVVCGLGNVGFRVAEELLRADVSVVVIDPAREGRFQSTVRNHGAAVIPGDATVADVLRQANVRSARAVVAATSSDLVNVEVALTARELVPQGRVVVRLSDADLARALRESTNVQLAIAVPQLAAPAFVAALYGDRVQSVFLVGGRLLAAVDVVVEAGEAVEGETVRAVAMDFRLAPVALIGAEGKSPAELTDYRLRPGDQLTVIAALTDLDRLYRRDRPPTCWSVVVDAAPPPACEPLIAMLRSLHGWDADEARRRLAQLPCEIRTGLTRGQAEDLIVLLRRERISARAVTASAGC